MNSRSMVFRSVVSLGFLAALLAGGCREGSRKEAEQYPLELQPTSIANVLTLFREAYQGRNYDQYRGLFDDSFAYHFAPQDVGGPNNIPADWNLTDELLSAQHLFVGAANRDGYRAEEIRLSFVASPDESTDVHPGWRKVVLSQVDLRIDARNTTTSDPLIYEVLGDKEELYLVETSEVEPRTNLHIWKIARWEDKPIELSSPVVARTTWGRIKSVWS